MIITILPNSSNFHAIAYNEKKVEKGLAELIEAVNINGLRPEAYTAGRTPQPRPSYHSHASTDTLLNQGGGSADANRESEFQGGMNVNDIDDENSQRMKWRR